MSAFFCAVLLSGFSSFFGPRGVRGTTSTDFVGLVSSPESSNSRSSFSSLLGECWSIQSLVVVWLQKASVFSRYGVGGMFTFPLDGEWRRLPFDGLDGGVCLVDAGFGMVGESSSITTLRQTVRLCFISWNTGNLPVQTVQELGRWVIVLQV